MQCIAAADLIAKILYFSYSLRRVRTIAAAGDASRGPVDNEKLEMLVSDIPIDSMQDANEVEMLEAKENWSVYRLADGTTLRIKPVMIAVFRADGQQGPGGEPVYNMKSTVITDVRVPVSSNKPN